MAEEFISLHRTASNFRAGRCLHTHIPTPAASILTCRRLAISDRHLAAGFSDGSVRLYDLPAASLIAHHAFHPHRDRLGQFSAAIVGIILLSQRRLVFASQDGDITVANVDEDNFSEVVARRARAGNLVEDGTLVDFAGDERRWVGLFAGVPGWSWRVWDGETEQEVYAGGSLTDADSVAGWHMLADISFPSVARIAVAAAGTVVGCTGSRVQAMRVGGMVEVTAEVSRFGVAAGRRMRREEMRPGRGVVGSMNWGYVVMWVGGVGRVWDALTGESLYALRRGTGEMRAAASSDS
ncbi:Transcriptional regulator STERILE APETALA [Platanthera zijinensis]|uniref:Transcriptional regulator STERILE APETALA n=1 Tax=Platanthera zijinensis TaxID=2320716 RepID=A0AAP0BME8_9ASPA